MFKLSVLFLVTSIPVIASANQVYSCKGKGRLGIYTAQLAVGVPPGMSVFRNGRVLVAVKGADSYSVGRDRNGNFVYEAQGYKNYQASITLSNRMFEDGTIPAHLDVTGGDDNEEEDQMSLFCKVR